MAAFLIGLLVPYLERALGVTDSGEPREPHLRDDGHRGVVHGDRDDPGREDRRSRRAQAGDLRGLSRSAGVGMTIVRARAVDPRLHRRGHPLGVGLGSFLAVDWALMTDIIPKASSGRYMGISQRRHGDQRRRSRAFIGGILIDALVRAGSPEAGPRVAFLLAPFWFAIGALLLRPVDERTARGRGPAPGRWSAGTDRFLSRREVGARRAATCRRSARP